MIPKPIAYLAQESNSPTQARRAINAGFKSVALELGVVTADAIKVARDAGLYVAVWSTGASLTPDKLPAGAQALICQIESPDQYDAALATFKALSSLNIDKAIITTYWGLYDPKSPSSSTRWNALAALGVTECQVECYKADGSPHDNVDLMIWQGTQYGIPATVLRPVVGTYRDEVPSSYTGIVGRAPNYGIYIIEQTSDVALGQWKLLNDSVAPPAPVIPNPAEINTKIAALAHTWLDVFGGDLKSLSRLRAIARIAKTSDSQWVNARARIVNALEDVGAPQG